MRGRVVLEIALTQMTARLRQSIVAALGVTFGIALFIALVSFMTGLNGLLDGLVLNRTPHIELYNEIEPSAVQPVDRFADFDGRMNIVRHIKPAPSLEKIHDALPIQRMLEADDRVADVAPRTTAQVFYQSGAIEVNGLVNGVDVAVEDRMFMLGDYLKEGAVDDLANTSDGIILGTGVAEKMQAALGDRITVISPSGARILLKVVGLYQSGLAEVDDVQSYTTLRTAQKLREAGNDFITRINVKLHDMEQAPAMGHELERLFDVSARDIQTANADFETGTEIRNLITYAVSITLLIVAGFGIYNILNMVIYEKMDQIAILKATGFSAADVRRIFIIQALVIGVVGGLVGMGLGYMLSVAISHAPFETEALPTITTYPVNIDPRFYAIATVFALCTTFFAGFLPSRKAGKVDPVEIIRGK